MTLLWDHSLGAVFPLLRRSLGIMMMMMQAKGRHGLEVMPPPPPVSPQCTHPCSPWTCQGFPGCSSGCRRSGHRAGSGGGGGRWWTSHCSRSTPYIGCLASSTASGHCPAICLLYLVDQLTLRYKVMLKQSFQSIWKLYFTEIKQLDETITAYFEINKRCLHMLSHIWNSCLCVIVIVS